MFSLFIYPHSTHFMGGNELVCDSKTVNNKTNKKGKQDMVLTSKKLVCEERELIK